MFRRILTALVSCAVLATAVAPAASSNSNPPKPFDVHGADAEISVVRGDATLPADQVPYLAAGDIIHIAFPKNVQFSRAPRWHLVVAEMYNGAHAQAPKFLISDADLSAAQPGAVWSVTDDGLGMPIIFLVPENGERYGHGVPQARGAISDLANRDLLLRSALVSSNVLAKATSLDAFMKSLKASSGAGVSVSDQQRIEAAGSTLFGKAPGTNACFSGGTSAATQYACAASVVAASYQSPSSAAVATTLGSQLAIEAAPYGALMGALYELLAKRRVQANYQFVPGAIKPGSSSTDVFVASPMQYDASGEKPSSVLYFQVGSQGAGARAPSFGAAPALPTCAAVSPFTTAVPFSGLPVYFRSNSIAFTSASGSFSVPASYDQVNGYNAPLTAAQLASLAGGATAIVTSQWGFDRFTSPSLAVITPHAVPWSLDPHAPAVVAGAGSATLTFSDGGNGQASCVENVAVRDGLGHAVPVHAVDHSKDDVTVTIDPSTAHGAIGSGVVTQAGGMTSDPVPFTILPAMPKIDRATAYLPRGVLVLSGTNLKYINTVRLRGSSLIFGNGVPSTKDDSWTYTALAPAPFDPAWQHETMIIDFSLEPPDARTDAAEVNVEYSDAASART